MLELDRSYDFYSLQYFFLGFPLHESVLESIRNVHVYDEAPAIDENAIPFIVVSGATISPFCLLQYEEWKSSRIENPDTRFTWDFDDVSQSVESKYFDIDVQSDEETDIISWEVAVLLASVVVTIVDAVTFIFILFLYLIASISTLNFQ